MNDEKDERAQEKTPPPKREIPPEFAAIEDFFGPGLDEEEDY